MATHVEPDNERFDVLTGLVFGNSRQAGLGTDYANADFGMSPRSSSTSVLSSSTQGSRFSRRSSSGYSSCSIDTWPSSAPSHQTGRQGVDLWTLEQNTEAVLPSFESTDDEIPRDSIPCEFRWLDGCRELFSAFEDISLYIAHAGEFHLGWQWPSTTVCWWCDNYKFPGTNALGPQMMFQRRMEHIRDHIVEEERRLTAPPRPDYFMLDHLMTIGKISPDIFDRMVEKKEGPSIDGVYPADWRPPIPERREMRICDNDKEERCRRREMKQGGKSRIRNR